MNKVVVCPTCKEYWVPKRENGQDKAITCSKCGYTPTEDELIALYNLIFDSAPDSGYDITVDKKKTNKKSPLPKTPSCKGDCSDGTDGATKCGGGGCAGDKNTNVPKIPDDYYKYVDKNNNKDKPKSKKHKPMTIEKVLKANEVSQRAIMNYINSTISKDKKDDLLTGRQIEAFNALANLQLAWASLFMVDRELL